MFHGFGFHWPHLSFASIAAVVLMAGGVFYLVQARRHRARPDRAGASAENAVARMRSWGAIFVLAGLLAAFGSITGFAGFELGVGLVATALFLVLMLVLPPVMIIRGRRNRRS